MESERERENGHPAALHRVSQCRMKSTANEALNGSELRESTASQSSQHDSKHTDCVIEGGRIFFSRKILNRRFCATRFLP